MDEHQLAKKYTLCVATVQHEREPAKWIIGSMLG